MCLRVCVCDILYSSATTCFTSMLSHALLLYFPHDCGDILQAFGIFAANDDSKSNDCFKKERRS